jgi:hypothetical protein
LRCISMVGFNKIYNLVKIAMLLIRFTVIDMKCTLEVNRKTHIFLHTAIANKMV